MGIYLRLNPVLFLTPLAKAKWQFKEAAFSDSLLYLRSTARESATRLSEPDSELYTAPQMRPDFRWRPD